MDAYYVVVFVELILLPCVLCLLKVSLNKKVFENNTLKDDVLKHIKNLQKQDRRGF